MTSYDECGLSKPRVTRESSSLMISDSLEVSGLSNPRDTRDSSSFVISDSLGGVWAVESMRHP
jgi:hypothetical protein